MTNLDRLCYLAVEKADLTFERFEAEMTFLMEVFQHVETRGERIQVVVTSRTWTKSIRQYAEKYLVSSAYRYSHYVNDFLFYRLAQFQHYILRTKKSPRVGLDWIFRF